MCGSNDHVRIEARCPVLRELDHQNNASEDSEITGPEMETLFSPVRT